MNFIPFGRRTGGAVVSADALRSKIVHTAKAIHGDQQCVVLTGISAMAAAGLIEPYREDITMATRYGDMVYAGWTIAGKCSSAGMLFVEGSLKLNRSDLDEKMSVWLSDYGDNTFQSLDPQLMIKTLKLDVSKLGLKLTILHPVEILKLYLNGCFQSRMEERYADYLIGILTRYCFEDGTLSQITRVSGK